jgi:dienelactone hydrolase
MKDAGVDYEFASYAGAVHAFTNPGADKFGLPGVKYNEKADKRSWSAMKALFNEVFGTRSTPAAAPTTPAPQSPAPARK